MLLTGHCHCGNIRFDFHTDYMPASLPLRACQCSFCRAHAAINTSDPRGQLQFVLADAAEVQRYRFGLGVTDMLICRRCGCYAVAIMEIDGRQYATLNTNLLDCRAELGLVPKPVNYAGETTAQRSARRLAGWTPVTAGLDLLPA